MKIQPQPNLDACFAKQILQGRVIYHRKKRTLKMKPRGLCFKKRILKSAFLGFIFWVRFMRSSEVTKPKPLKTNPLKPTLCTKYDRFPIPSFLGKIELIICLMENIANPWFESSFRFQKIVLCFRVSLPTFKNALTIPFHVLIVKLSNEESN